ncbi:gliding motility-associated C-terminal domain-containing protein [Pontibacter sp. E15-1]|uniref:lectin-like domain-containing protein n=1 Tax=Pontibacter sp. E15-1 TaxID=2919918 RepID=UPI001F4FAEEC|nr:gliding motility-associated C-terminal domain-containing protein [Pontibacter sp. E15-1]MCJ8165350.1 gliding motility-associated C-terminal domain-containing protein [Pontibacter sp. E15-1]
MFLIAISAPSIVLAQFVTRGDAVKLSGMCYKITEDRLERYGSIWADKKIDLTKPVELEFIIYMGTKDKEGADGIAFLFHNDSRGFEATGATGGGLGFSQPYGISPSVAIEFDTWHNENDPADIAVDHTALSYNGDISRPKVAAIQIDPNNPDVENNQCHTYRISWNPETKQLKLFFDGQERFNHTDDIVRNVFRGSAEVYYGFTGSTGGNSNEQTICVLGYGGEPVATDDFVEAEPGKPITVDVLANDTHTGGTTLTLTSIVHQEGQGTVEIAGGKLIYTPDAWTAEADDVLTYEVSDAGSGQCYAKTTTAKVRIKVRCNLPLAPAEIVAAGPISFCEGGQVKLLVPGMVGPTYTWKKDGKPFKAQSQEITVKQLGSYTVDVTTVCGTVTASPVVVQVFPLPGSPVAPAVERCGPGAVTLTATGGKNGEYRWYTASSGTASMDGETGPSYTSPALTDTTTYYVSLVRNGCESTREPVKAAVHPIPDIAPVATHIITQGDAITLNKPDSNAGTRYAWSPAFGLSDPNAADPIASPEETTRYTVVAITAAGCQVTGQVNVLVRQKIMVPNAFSPNGDGMNETWEIKTLEAYPTARVEVYDRWGTRVFDKVRYTSEWDGTFGGRPLPVSTYYYVITLPEDIQGQGKKITGSVSIVH